jgi:hypothetical protein
MSLKGLRKHLFIIILSEKTYLKVVACLKERVADVMPEKSRCCFSRNSSY